MNERMEGTHSQKNLSVDAVGSVVTTAQRWETIISHPRVHGEVPCLLEVMAREGIDGDQFVLWMSELGKFNAKERQVQGGRQGGRQRGMAGPWWPEAGLETRMGSGHSAQQVMKML